MKMIKGIFKDIFKQKGIIIIFLLGMISEIGYIALPYIGKFLIDYIEASDLGTPFWNYIYLALIIIFVVSILAALSSYLFTGLRSKYELNKTKYYHEKFLNLDYEQRIEEGTGKAITKITRGVGAQVGIFSMLFDFLSIVTTRFIFIGFIFFAIYPPVILVLILSAIFLGILNILLAKKIKQQTDIEQEQMEEVGRETSKIIMESDLIKILNKEEYEINKLDKLTQKIPKVRQKIFLLNGMFFNILDFVIETLKILCYAILGLMVIKSEMTLGELTMTITYIAWLWMPIAMLVNNLVEVRNEISKIDALEKFVNQKNKIIDGKNTYKFKNGEINIENIDFYYEGNQKIYNNFSLNIPGGKTLALVGNSGSGKSTLIKLILRDYKLEKGKIEIDGQNVNDLKISTLYDNIGYLSQEPAVFDGTIKENLQYATNKKLKKDELEEALKKVDLYDLVNNSSKGINTEIGEKGLKLSGGEKQRLAIARIFLRNPKILILDEPTSSLDSISENKITNILNNVMKDKTVIVIAHRLQTVMNSDKIVVLKNGKVVETGKHKELIEKNGTYSKLIDLQRGIVKE